MHPLQTISLKAARLAGDIILRGFDRLDKVIVNTKTHNDFVTDIDSSAEQVIIATIRQHYPNHGIIAEESGQATQNGDDYTWIIDPLDGTTNFVHGLPHFSVSIAVMHKNRLEHGLIYDPVRQEVFSAVRGEGAKLNDRRIRVAEATTLDSALLSTGFPFRNLKLMDNYIAIMNELVRQSGDLRRGGSAALDLAYVAAGRLDGHFEYDLKMWDIAAGALLVKEAGGLVTDFQGGEDYLKSGDIVAANPKLIKKILQVCRG